MIDRNHALPLTRQAELVGISRGSVYYLARAASAADLRLMRRIDELSLAHPFAGSRMLRDMLNREGFDVGRRHVATLMRRMGIEALYRKPNTSKKHPNHKIYPYLLRELKIDRANQVWASDITYVPMACGWVYLCAIVDLASRKVLAHRVSISMDTAFCVEALEEAFSKYGKPEIFNSDKGSQFAGEAFTEALKACGVAISMDGKGAWRTTSSSSGSGDRSSTKRCICTPTTRSATPRRESHATSISTTRPARTRRSTRRRRTSSTSRRRQRSNRQHER
jgi:putative transposase